MAGKNFASTILWNKISQTTMWCYMRASKRNSGDAGTDIRPHRMAGNCKLGTLGWNIIALLLWPSNWIELNWTLVHKMRGMRDKYLSKMATFYQNLIIKLAYSHPRKIFNFITECPQLQNVVPPVSRPKFPLLFLVWNLWFYVAPNIFGTQAQYKVPLMFNFGNIPNWWDYHLGDDKSWETMVKTR